MELPWSKSLSAGTFSLCNLSAPLSTDNSNKNNNKRFLSNFDQDVALVGDSVDNNKSPMSSGASNKIPRVQNKEDVAKKKKNDSLTAPAAPQSAGPMSPKRKKAIKISPAAPNPETKDTKELETKNSKEFDKPKSYNADEVRSYMEKQKKARKLKEVEDFQNRQKEAEMKKKQLDELNEKTRKLRIKNITLGSKPYTAEGLTRPKSEKIVQSNDPGLQQQMKGRKRLLNFSTGTTKVRNLSSTAVVSPVKDNHVPTSITNKRVNLILKEFEEIVIKECRKYLSKTDQSVRTSVNTQSQTVFIKTPEQRVHRAATVPTKCDKAVETTLSLEDPEVDEEEDASFSSISTVKSFSQVKNRLDRAASLIQATYRGYKIRKILRECQLGRSTYRPPPPAYSSDAFRVRLLDLKNNKKVSFRRGSGSPRTSSGSSEYHSQRRMKALPVPLSPKPTSTDLLNMQLGLYVPPTLPSYELKSTNIPQLANLTFPLNESSPKLGKIVNEAYPTEALKRIKGSSPHHEKLSRFDINRNEQTIRPESRNVQPSITDALLEKLRLIAADDKRKQLWAEKHTSRKSAPEPRELTYESDFESVSSITRHSPVAGENNVPSQDTSITDDYFGPSDAERRNSSTPIPPGSPAKQNAEHVAADLKKTTNGSSPESTTVETDADLVRLTNSKHHSTSKEESVNSEDLMVSSVSTPSLDLKNLPIPVLQLRLSAERERLSILDKALQVIIQNCPSQSSGFDRSEIVKIAKAAVDEHIKRKLSEYDIPCADKPPDKKPSVEKNRSTSSNFQSSIAKVRVDKVNKTVESELDKVVSTISPNETSPIESIIFKRLIPTAEERDLREKLPPPESDLGPEELLVEDELCSKIVDDCEKNRSTSSNFQSSDAKVQVDEEKEIGQSKLDNVVSRISPDEASPIESVISKRLIPTAEERDLREKPPPSYSPPSSESVLRPEEPLVEDELCSKIVDDCQNNRSTSSNLQSSVTEVQVDKVNKSVQNEQDKVVSRVSPDETSPIESLISKQIMPPAEERDFREKPPPPESDLRPKDLLVEDELCSKIVDDCEKNRSTSSNLQSSVTKVQVDEENNLVQSKLDNVVSKISPDEASPTESLISKQIMPPAEERDFREKPPPPESDLRPKDLLVEDELCSKIVDDCEKNRSTRSNLQSSVTEVQVDKVNHTVQNEQDKVVSRISPDETLPIESLISKQIMPPAEERDFREKPPPPYSPPSSESDLRPEELLVEDELCSKIVDDCDKNRSTSSNFQSSDAKVQVDEEKEIGQSKLDNVVSTISPDETSPIESLIFKRLIPTAEERELREKPPPPYSPPSSESVLRPEEPLAEDELCSKIVDDCEKNRSTCSNLQSSVTKVQVKVDEVNNIVQNDKDQIVSRISPDEASPIESLISKRLIRNAEERDFKEKPPPPYSPPSSESDLRPEELLVEDELCSKIVDDCDKNRSTSSNFQSSDAKVQVDEENNFVQSELDNVVSTVSPDEASPIESLISKQIMPPAEERDLREKPPPPYCPRSESDLRLEQDRPTSNNLQLQSSVAEVQVDKENNILQSELDNVVSRISPEETLLIESLISKRLIPTAEERDLREKPPPPYSPPSSESLSCSFRSFFINLETETLKSTVKSYVQQIWDDWNSKKIVPNVTIDSVFIASRPLNQSYSFDDKLKDESASAAEWAHSSFDLLMTDILQDITHSILQAPDKNLVDFVRKGPIAIETQRLRIPKTQEELVAAIVDASVKIIPKFILPNEDAPPSVPLKWTCRARDLVDELLVEEMVEDEPLWSDLWPEELLVKDELCNKIVDDCVRSVFHDLKVVFGL